MPLVLLAEEAEGPTHCAHKHTHAHTPCTQALLATQCPHPVETSATITHPPTHPRPRCLTLAAYCHCAAPSTNRPTAQLPHFGCTIAPHPTNQPTNQPNRCLTLAAYCAPSLSCSPLPVLRWVKASRLREYTCMSHHDQQAQSDYAIDHAPPNQHAAVHEKKLSKLQYTKTTKHQSFRVQQIKASIL